MKILLLALFLMPVGLAFAQDSTFTIYEINRARKEEIWSKDLLDILANEKTNSVGKRAPELSFQTIPDQTTHTLSEFRGNIVFLNFWDRSCRPCIAEMPVISELQDDYYSAGLRVVFLSSSDFETQNRFYSTDELSGIKGRVNEEELRKPYQFFVIPMSILVDRSGIIHDAWFGRLEYDHMEARLNKLIPRDSKSFRLKKPTIVIMLSIAGVGLIIFGFVAKRKTAKTT